MIAPETPPIVGTANLDFTRRHDPAYIRHMCETTTVWGGQEAKDVTVRDHVPKGWGVRQDTSTPARAGCSLAWDGREWTSTDLPARWTLGASPTWLGKRLGMLPRWILEVQLQHITTGRYRTFIVSHAPPRRFGMLLPGFKRQLRVVTARHRHWTVLTDANEPITRLGDYLGGNAYPRTGIVGIITSHTSRLEGVCRDRWGVVRGFTDHDAITGIQTWPKL